MNIQNILFKLYKIVTIVNPIVVIGMICLRIYFKQSSAKNHSKKLPVLDKGKTSNIKNPFNTGKANPYPK